MEPIRVGTIGCGYWGPNVIRNFVETPGAELHAVADLDPAKLESITARHPQIEMTTTDHRRLFDLDLDAVAICTPPQTHLAIARECLENGLDVLVEKPLTTTSDDAQTLIDVADAHDRILMVGHTFVYNPAVQALKRMLDNNALGQIRYIDAVRVGLGLYHPSLNVVWDLAPHDVSILLHLFGTMPETVSATGVACVHDVVEDVAYLTLTFAPGILTHVRVSWLDPSKIRRVTIVGSESMVIYDDVEPNEKLRVFDKGVEALRTPDTFGEFQFNYRYGDIVSPYIDFQEPLRVQAEHFLECVRDRRTPTTDGHAGLRVVKVLEALQESLRDRGRPVAITPLPEAANGSNLDGARPDTIDLTEESTVA